MIIKCDNCNKSFQLDSDLIPEKGRLLQCNACDHKWFFKKEIKEILVPVIKIEDIADELTPFKEDETRVETENPKTIELLDKTTKNVVAIDKISIQNNNESEEITGEDKEPNIKKSINKKNYNILGITIVFIISFIAIIIVLDTFQKPISILIPNIEFILYNLYEAINDMILFFSDLI
jgi:predicted Zn finger-like uncharacterized protein